MFEINWELDMYITYQPRAEFLQKYESGLILSSLLTHEDCEQARFHPQTSPWCHHLEMVNFVGQTPTWPWSMSPIARRHKVVDHCREVHSQSWSNATKLNFNRGLGGMFQTLVLLTSFFVCSPSTHQLDTIGGSWWRVRVDRFGDFRTPLCNNSRLSFPISKLSLD